MENNFETFILAYQMAPQPIKDIIDSEDIGIFVNTLLATHSLDSAYRQRLIVIVSNRLLSITSDAEVKTALQTTHIEPPVIDKISALILAFVLGKIDTAIEASVQKDSILEERVPTDSPSKAPVTDTSHIRTMAKDMERAQSAPEEAVYTTTQEAILRERSDSSSTPKQ